MRHVGWQLGCSIYAVFAGFAAAGQPVLVGVEEDTGDFYAISTTNASLQLIGHSGIENLGALEFNPNDGFFYGFTTGETSATLYRFEIPASLDTVSATPVGPLGVAAFEGGLVFAPDGTAYAVNGGVTVPSLLTLNLTTGQATVVASLDGRHDLAGLAWRSDNLLTGLDSTDNDLLAISPANAAFTKIDDIAPLIGGVGGMALLDGVGYFVTAGPLAGPSGQSPGSNELFSFDPLTGEHFFVGSFEDFILGSGFSGLSVVPEPASLTLLGLACLCLGLRRRMRWPLRGPRYLPGSA